MLHEHVLRRHHGKEHMPRRYHRETVLQKSRVMAISVMISRYMVFDRCASRCRIARIVGDERPVKEALIELN